MAGSLCPGQKQKIGSLPEPVLRDLLIAADYVLIEADGAKHYSLKYPAEHEPVIPAESTDVILVLGIWDLGKSCQDVIFRFDKMCIRDSRSSVSSSKTRIVPPQTMPSSSALSVVMRILIFSQAGWGTPSLIL